MRLQNRREPSAGPPADADAFVRIRFACHRVRKIRDAARVPRRGAAREARVSKVKAPPPEMHGTRLAEEATAELLQNALGLDEDLPACSGRDGIVGAMDGIRFEPNRVGDFDGPRPNARPHVDAL